jgi:hypothetical protein
MNNIQNKIDQIVNKVLSEELNKKIENAKSRIDEKSKKDEKWIQDVDMKKGDFTEYCGGKVSCSCVAKAQKEGGKPAKMANLYLNMNEDKCKSLRESMQEIDEMEEFYEIALKRKQERMEAKNAKPDFLDLDGDGDKEESMKKAAKEKKETKEDKNAKPDFLDLDKDGDKKEPMKKAAKDAKNESKKQTLQLTEDEMIELIERIVIQEKSAVETLEKKNDKETKKTNDDYIKDVTKKMKDYMKDMGVKYEPESKEFPRGNTMMDITGKDGKTKKSDTKKMYHASDAVEEYIDQVARAGGMENLDYDQIKPNEDWVEMNIEGSSKTGNSPEYANAVPTDVNKNVNKRRKLNILAKLKKMSYQKADQPVYDVAGDEKHSDSMKFLEEKKSIKINEDLDKIKNLIDYNRKTQ